MNDKKVLAIFAITVLVFLGLIFFNRQNPTTTEQELGINLNEEQANDDQAPSQDQESTPSMNNQNKSYASAPQMQLEEGKDYKATIKTSKGDIVVDLFETEVPNTVNNFVFLAKDNYYNNTKFHRIIKGFMIQGGDPLGNGTGGPGYKFADEPVTREYKKGTIAMANSGPNTNGSQFFIMHADYPLPKNYTIFGQATDEASLKVIDEIGNTPVKASAMGEASSPTETVTVNEVVIE